MEGFDTETWVPEVKSDLGVAGQRYGIDTPLTEATLLRLPFEVPIAKRHLTKAAWGELSLLERICLCILHGGMRTCENLTTKLCEVRPPTQIGPRICSCAVGQLGRSPLSIYTV